MEAQEDIIPRAVGAQEDIKFGAVKALGAVGIDKTIGSPKIEEATSIGTIGT